MNFTVFFTVLSGVITFVIGQLIVKLLLDPIQDMKKTIGQVSHTLVEQSYLGRVSESEAIRWMDILHGR